MTVFADQRLDGQDIAQMPDEGLLVFGPTT